MDEGPTSKWRQPPVGEEEKQVLRKKISRFINRRYIAPIPGKFESPIKYFAVPKGNDDWRIVFHTGANKLNDRVWALLFCLPSINMLLRIINGETLMSDCDMGDMFHNFPLHANTVKFTTIDLAPLDFWTRRLQASVGVLEAKPDGLQIIAVQLRTDLFGCQRDYQGGLA
jgi:hypothetical protein